MRRPIIDSDPAKPPIGLCIVGVFMILVPLAFAAYGWLTQ